MKQIIEAEGGEYYLGKNQEGVIRGKSHAEGGVDMLAETNDFIFPKKYTKIAQTLREEMMGYQKEIERYSKNSKKYGNKDVVESGMQRLQQRNNMGIEAAAAKLKELMLITAVEKQQKEANKYAKGSFIDPPKTRPFVNFSDPISRIYSPKKNSFYTPVPTIPGSYLEKNVGPYIGVWDENFNTNFQLPPIQPLVSSNYRKRMREYIDAVEGVTSGNINPDGVFGLPENLRNLDFVRSGNNNPVFASENRAYSEPIGDYYNPLEANRILFKGLPKTKRFDFEKGGDNQIKNDNLNNNTVINNEQIINTTTPQAKQNPNDIINELLLMATNVTVSGNPLEQKKLLFNIPNTDYTSGLDNLGGTSLGGESVIFPTEGLKSRGIKQLNNPSPKVKPSDLEFLEKNFAKKLPEDENGNPPMFSYGDAAIFAGGVAPMLYNFIMGSKPAEEYKLGRVKKLSPTLVSDAAALRDQRTVLSSLIAGTKRSRLTPAQRQALLSGIAATGLRGMQDTSLNFANQNAGIINQTNAQNAQIDAQNIGFQDKENNINMANRAARTNFTTKGFENLNSMLVNAGQGLNKKQQGLDLYDIYMSNPDYFRALFENGKFKGTEYITS